MKVKDLRRLNEEQATEWISRQSDVYTHNQNQAYRLIQLVVAAGSLLIVLLANSVPVLEGMISSDDVVFAPRLPTEVQQVVFNSADIVGLVFILLAILFVFDSVQWAFDVLTYDNPEPGLGGSISGRDLQIEVGEHEPHMISDTQTMHQSQMSNWLEANQKLLSEMDTKLETSYQHLAIGVGILVIGILFLVFSEIEILGSIVTMMVLYTVFGYRRAKNTFYSLIKNIKLNWENNSGKNLTHRLKISITSIKTGIKMKGNKNKIVFLLITFNYIWVAATTVVVVLWIPLPDNTLNIAVYLFV